MVVVVARRRELTLAAQFLALQLGVIAVVLFIVGVISVRQSTSTFAAERGTAMRSVAEYVANIEPVRLGLADATSDADLARSLAPLVDRGLNLSGASDVYIVSTAGVVLAASEPSLVGERAELGASDALQGRGWVGEVDGADGSAVAAHAPIYDDAGDLQGLAVAEQTYPSVADRLTGAASDLALYLGLGAALGIVGSYVVSRVVRRRTQGLAPTQIAHLADHREALLHSIREGVVAVDTDDRVTMMNDAARHTLEITGDPTGRVVHDLGLDPHVVSLLVGDEGDDVHDAVALVGTRVLVLNRRSASSRGRGIGSVTTLRDRTELLSLQGQLSSNLSMTDTLRAQTHEFDNRLHTISGLIQLGEFDEVRALVGTLTQRRSEMADAVAARIADPALAAVIIGKDAAAEERGVQLVLDPGSQLPELDPEASADLTTMVGNLIDNAVDACAGSTDALVEVWITTIEGSAHVRVRDNGPGVPEELRDAVFVRGFSTKPDVLGGRGIGLPLVRLIATQRGGRVDVGSTDDGGAEFTATVPLGHVRPGRAEHRQDDDS
ncbi:MAG: ATP-binding protein [Nocardioides sp.]